MCIVAPTIRRNIGLVAALAHRHISSRSIVLVLLFVRMMLGELDKSVVLVQSQVEAYILTLLVLASIEGQWVIDCTDRYKSLEFFCPHTHTKSRSPRMLEYTMALARLI
jgi:hypothetical protein